MRYQERFEAHERNELHEELCHLVDQLFELSHKWWRVDPGLVAAHYDGYPLNEKRVELTEHEKNAQQTDEEIDF